MSRIYTSIRDLVGHTPLFEPMRLEQELGLSCHLLCKLEWFNPAGSIKDRAAKSMLEAAERDGTLHPGDTIVEQTSGNTGIALAAMAVPKGYHVEIFLEAGVTIERKKILQALGCRLLTYRDIPGAADPSAPFDPFREATLSEIQHYCDLMGPSYHFLNQVTNRNNPRAHVETTGPELWEDAGGKIDALVCMAGTGGTLCGLSTYLRKKNPEIYIAAAEPAPCSVRCRENPHCRMIDGVLRLSDACEGGFLHEDLFDETIDVVTEDAFVTAQAFAALEGLLVGTSGAAALHAAVSLGRRDAFRGKNIAVIIPDGGSKYLSCPLYTFHRDRKKNTVQ